MNWQSPTTTSARAETVCHHAVDPNKLETVDTASTKPLTNYILNQYLVYRQIEGTFACHKFDIKLLLMNCGMPMYVSYNFLFLHWINGYCIKYAKVQGFLSIWRVIIMKLIAYFSIC